MADTLQTMESLPDAARAAFRQALDELPAASRSSQQPADEPAAAASTTSTEARDERLEGEPKEKRKAASATDAFSCVEDKLAFRMAQGFFEVLDLETVCADEPPLVCRRLPLSQHRFSVAHTAHTMRRSTRRSMIGRRSNRRRCRAHGRTW